MSLHAQKARFVFVDLRGRYQKWSEKNRISKPCGNLCRKAMTLKFVRDQICLKCTQRQAKVNEQAVQSKTERFRRFMTTGGSDGKDLANESNPSRKIAAWGHDMTGHAQKCVERYCDFAEKDVPSVQSVATPCVDDHLIPPEDFEVQGELSDVCAQIVLKCLYLAGIGWPDLFRSGSTFARSVSKWGKACGKRWLRWINCHSRTKDDGPFCHVTNNLQNWKKWMPNCKEHAATGESTRYRTMTRIFSKWVRTLVWNWTGTKFLRCHSSQEETAEGNFVRASRDEISIGKPETNSKKAYVQKEMNQISEKEHVGSFHNSLVHMLITILEAVTKWNKACGKRLLRLINYNSQTEDDRPCCHVTKKFEDCKLGLFQYASFTDDLQHSKSRFEGFKRSFRFFYISSVPQQCRIEIHIHWWRFTNKLKTSASGFENAYWGLMCS